MLAELSQLPLGACAGMQAGWLREAPPRGLALGSPGPHARGWSYAPHFLPRGFTCMLRYPSGWLVRHRGRPSSFCINSGVKARGC